MKQIQPLEIPNLVNDADKAMELARIWIADKTPTFVISGNLWSNPSMWGLLMADFLDHIASAYEQNGSPKDEVYSQILNAFNAEVNNPT